MVCMLLGLGCGGPTYAWPENTDQNDRATDAPLAPAFSLTLTSSPNVLLADGVHTSNVLATWTDAGGRPLTGRPLSFATLNPNRSRLSRSTVVTDCKGQARIAWASTLGQPQVLLAGDAGIKYARVKVDFRCPGALLQPVRWPVFNQTATALIAHDFNQDGYPDLASLHAADNTLAISLGLGNGLFDTPTYYAFNGPPQQLVAVDFDRDGILDLVCSRPAAGILGLLRGNPNGTFVAQSNQVSGNAPGALRATDLNGDGNQDLLVANSNDNTVAVLLGDGYRFAAAVPYAVGSGPVALSLADFNLDGQTDVAVANGNGNSISVLRGLANGTLAPLSLTTLPTAPSALASADFNADQRPDLAVASSNANAIYILMNSGNGNFTVAQTFAGLRSPAALRSLDVDQDGYPDLLAADGGGNVLRYWRGGASGSLSAAPNLPTAASPGMMAMADFDGDGRQDLAVAHVGGAVGILQGNATLGFVATDNYATSTTNTMFRVADFDRDGRLDFITQDTGALTQFRGRGDGTFVGAQRIELTTNVSYGLDLGDVNGDGQVDVVQSIYPGANSRYNVLQNNSGALSLASSANVFHAVQLGLGDLNQDGNLDMAMISTDTNTILNQYRGSGNGNLTLASTLYLPALTSYVYNSIVVAEITGDGWPDIIISQESIAEVYVYAGDGNFGVSAPQRIALPAPGRGLGLADFNGDGRLDVAIPLGFNGQTAVLLAGGNTLSPPTLLSTPGNAVAIAVGDFTRDGRPDLAVANLSGNQVYLLAGLGGGSFAAAQSYLVGPSPAQLAAADFDNDGAIDLLVNLQNAKLQVVLLNSKCSP